MLSNPRFSGPTRPVSFSPKRIAADRDAVLGTALRGTDGGRITLKITSPAVAASVSSRLGASELTCTTMHGFCYQLIRVEASGSRDQAVALVRRPLPSRAGLHPGRGRDGEPRYPLVC